MEYVDVYVRTVDERGEGVEKRTRDGSRHEHGIVGVLQEHGRPYLIHLGHKALTVLLETFCHIELLGLEHSNVAFLSCVVYIAPSWHECV